MTGRYRSAEMKSSPNTQRVVAGRDKAGSAEPRGRFRLGDRARRPALLGLFGVLLVGLLAAVGAVGYYGWQAYQTYAVDEPRQTLRDDSEEVAQQAILNVLTIDPSDTATWQSRVDASLTGEAREQVSSQVIEDVAGQVDEAGGAAATLTARIERSVPTKVDVSGDTAEVMVFAVVAAAAEGQEPTTRPFSFLVTVVDTGDGRKVSRIADLDALAFSEPEGEETPAGDAEGTPEGGN